jgi:hypothetical protein
VFAAASRVFADVQMPLTLPPAPINSAAEARHTKASNSVYSIKSWPCSSVVKARSARYMGHQYQSIVSIADKAMLKLGNSDGGPLVNFFGGTRLGQSSAGKEL